MKRILLAIQFLTIIPAKAKGDISEKDIAMSASFFVLVGIFQGILLGITDYAAGAVFHPDLVIGIVLLMLVLSNGGFHLDGLADTFDALAVKSSGNAEEDRRKRLEVMKGSTTGAIGVTAIVFVILFKYLALKNISHLLPFTYYMSLILMPAVSKWAVVMAIFHGRAAREDGLGRIFINNIGIREFSISTLTLIFFLVLPQISLIRYGIDSQYIFYTGLIAAIYIFCRLYISFFNKKFGGLTGDTLGAINELTEIVFLLMVITWSRLSI